MKNERLGSLELLVLLAIARLADEAYGLAIRRDVSVRTRHDYSVGAVYTALERLEEKGFVSSHTTDPLPVRGGRSRRQFTISADGRRVLREAERIATSAWAGLRTSTRTEPA